MDSSLPCHLAYGNLNGDGFGIGWFSPDHSSPRTDPSPCVFTSVTPAWCAGRSVACVQGWQAAHLLTQLAMVTVLGFLHSSTTSFTFLGADSHCLVGKCPEPCKRLLQGRRECLSWRGVSPLVHGHVPRLMHYCPRCRNSDPHLRQLCCNTVPALPLAEHSLHLLQEQ